MLKKGRFIKEEAPKIGVLYEPRPLRPDTPEEKFVRNILLGGRNPQYSLLSSVIGRILKI